ncbi:MAG: formamidopyrimidine-DNA glycosylase [Deltaproteobacteria bacterium]|nr:formamidopyrimidine-DNA glycosylase [Deltaproteobacteria bacterium]
MPELPDLTIYLDALASRIVGQPLEAIRLANPFVLRSVAPATGALVGHRVTGLRRIGKRLVIELSPYAIAMHLMIAGRLRWLAPKAKIPGRLGLAAFDFPTGALVLTEAGTKRRASITLLEGEAAIAALDAGGLEISSLDAATFGARLRQERHTLKRTLTDPRLFAGIGNAYSDEILHRARMSPVKMSTSLKDDEVARLLDATQAVMREWIDRLRSETGDRFPEKVTAFREGMAVHGRYGKPCPDCGTPVQRIVHAENETNYCPRCQTEGRILADRSLSRLLKEDWPRTVEELEQLGARKSSHDTPKIA